MKESFEQLLTPTERAAKTADTIHMLRASSESQLQNLKAIIEEREYQDGLWGIARDRDHMTENLWLQLIYEYANGFGRAKNYEFRKRMVKAAALALAALEALDGREARRIADDEEKVGG